MPKDNSIFLKLPSVEQKTALKRSTIYNLISLGMFPQPIKLSARSSAWVSSEIEDWMQDRIDQSRGVSK